MTDPQNPAQELQEEFLNSVRMSQDAVIEAIKTWVETVQSMTPKVPPVQVPFAEKLPRPEQVGTSAYDFAEQVLASQRKFAEDILKATAPLLPGEGRSAIGAGTIAGSIPPGPEFDDDDDDA